MMGSAHILVVRDGTVRILDKNDTPVFENPVTAVTARLTKSRVVHLQSGAESTIVYGMTDITRLPKSLRAIADREAVNAQLIEPAKTGALGVYSPKGVTGAAALSRQILEGLVERGAQPG